MISSISEKNVFINCPLDDEYLPLLRSLIFTLLTLGYTPRIAKERLDSGEPRFRKICELISESQYGIHDLSRVQAKKKGEYLRLNMPFELGLDIGCRVFNELKYSTKKCLILAQLPQLSKEIEVFLNSPTTETLYLSDFFFSFFEKRQNSDDVK